MKKKINCTISSRLHGRNVDKCSVQNGVSYIIRLHIYMSVIFSHLILSLKTFRKLGTAIWNGSNLGIFSSWGLINALPMPNMCTIWRCLNRLRTGVTCSKEQRKKWDYYEGDTTCDCGVSSENTRHMLECPLLSHSCSLDDLLQFNETAKECVEQWKTAV